MARLETQATHTDREHIMTTLHVLRLSNGLYRKVHPTLSNVAALSLDEAKRAKAGHPDSVIEPFLPFEIYPTEFAD